MKVHKKGGDAKKSGGGGGDGGFEDEELECRDCNAKFTFTVGEQEFYAQKGFDNKPVRGRFFLFPCTAASAARGERAGPRVTNYNINLRTRSEPSGAENNI